MKRREAQGKRSLHATVLNQKTYPKLSQLLDAETFSQKRICCYCGKRFTPARRDQKYCKPSIERKLNWERRKALAGALARQFRRWGWHAQDLLKVAVKCVEAAYEAVMTAMSKLGWRWNERNKMWLLKSGN